MRCVSSLLVNILCFIMYSGMNVRLRYLVRVTITRSYSNCVKEQEFAVQNFLTVANQAIAEAPVQGIKMEVGIEDCLHIEFEFDKQKYHLKVGHDKSRMNQ